MKKISVRTVAKAAGVSPATVSRVINDNRQVSRETRKKVIACARELGYDLVGRSGSWTVGVIMELHPDSVNGYYGNLLAAVSEELSRRNCHLELVRAEDLKRLEESTIRGALDLSMQPGVLSAWQSDFTLPLVRINAPSSRLNGIGAVLVDGIAAARLAVELFWKQGHRKIFFISFEGRESEERKALSRWKGFTGMLREYGVENPEEFGLFLNRNPEQAIAGLKQALERGCTAICCPNEYLALRLEPILRKLDVRVPEELSVIEWEFAGISANLVPPRTTLEVDYRQLAFEAAEMLDGAIRTRTIPPDRVVPMRLIERASVAPPPICSGLNSGETE